MNLPPVVKDPKPRPHVDPGKHHALWGDPGEPVCFPTVRPMCKSGNHWASMILLWTLLESPLFPSPLRTSSRSSTSPHLSRSQQPPALHAGTCSVPVDGWAGLVLASRWFSLKPLPEARPITEAQWALDAAITAGRTSAAASLRLRAGRSSHGAATAWNAGISRGAAGNRGPGGMLGAGCLSWGLTFPQRLSECPAVGGGKVWISGNDETPGKPCYLSPTSRRRRWPRRARERNGGTCGYGVCGPRCAGS